MYRRMKKQLGREEVEIPRHVPMAMLDTGVLKVHLTKNWMFQEVEFLVPHGET